MLVESERCECYPDRHYGKSLWVNYSLNVTARCIRPRKKAGLKIKYIVKSSSSFRSLTIYRGMRSQYGYRCSVLWTGGVCHRA